VQLLALVDSPDHVCCRYRLDAFRNHFESAGHALQLVTLPRHWWEWFRLGALLHQADLVILQRRLPRPWQLALLRRSARQLAYDFDDAIFLRDSYSSKGFQSRRRARRFADAVAAVDLVVAGNDFLREQTTLLAGTDCAQVIATCVDPDRYPLAHHERQDVGVQLAWIGSTSTLQGLDRVRSLLNTVGAACPGVSLKLICDRTLSLDSLPVKFCPWSEATEASDLADTDIGISWLPDDPWSRGKCGLKVLQYMAAGLPVVANPVGVQAEFVRHGTNGFLAETPEEWVKSVQTLASNPDLRRQMGFAGRKRVESDFSVAAGARCWLDLLDRTVLRTVRAKAA
jgi:glycosyltransferase involved in cell wall biosynthesis